MKEGTTQGSPLSPVLALIYIARTLRQADETISGTSSPQPNKRYPTRGGHLGRSPKVTVEVFSYADDVNPLVITDNTSDHS